MIDAYEDIDGFDCVTSSDVFDFDNGTWISDCNLYVIKIFDGEDYIGFDTYFNDEAKNKEWYKDIDSCSYCLKFEFSLSDVLRQISQHKMRMRGLKNV